ncbi:aldehyde dehydrogenase (NAD+)/betaine-aldehyde dehydrogenase [Limimonas halophila]|uniref:Aldehyde dehydrogenase (NAD+)/betaine-aldehyde dehydrogenase n=1 Tax=Limimonas halophila TaxID=1082479 RepID=A0A1G7NI85_9PROT|nr:aldehyde dehydrogenase family protein [Limimonas halophila]SDF73815.1 aldehyde dehydrogenase (NAD+)/betaine-aldehyde dehydrogenase [Limimonas halophila]
MTADAELKPVWQNHIAGEWRDGPDGARIPVENPATGERLADIARATPEVVDQAVQAARACTDSRVLQDMHPAERARVVTDIGRVLRRRREEIARVVCLDSGKSLSLARGEVDGAARYFEYYGGLADKIEGRYIPLGNGYVDYTIPVPYGVSAHIVPWNFPLEMAARSLAPALAAGNACVIKSPEQDPLAVTFIAEACAELGVPTGAVNIVCGYGEDAGAALSAHPDVNQIVFTGSVETGQAIMRAAADTVVPTVMELGGKSAGIVFPDADLDNLTTSTSWGITMNSGQVCNAMSRLLVPRQIRDEVIDRIKAMSEGLSIGPGIEDNGVTPLISGEHLAEVEGHCLSAAQQGAREVTGGRRLADRAGHFMPPTVYADVDPEMRIAQEEVFGPVLSVMTYNEPDEAIRIANGTKYGLAAGVFTGDLDRATWAAERLVAGQVYVNDWYVGGVETPFGGMGKSGFGREKGQEALANYYQSKNVGMRRLAS